ncbi:hypothetical protein CLV84_0007 [Neolewinella xylanilytica]|uniref:Uncharacterized protein n=2 Tax=Neolewinella xylanilytica TaxID=1514080 RepID=A0A2S6IBP7_9BACT|nr:hypothetical protein CLV84_0007 [Neolewinella xylanilytica]
MSEWEFKLAAEKDNWIFIDKKVTDSSIQFVIKHNPMSNYIDLLYLLMVYNIDYRKVYVEDGMFGNYWLKDTNIKS